MVERESGGREGPRCWGSMNGGSPGEGMEVPFNLKPYDLVGCGPSSVLLAAVSERTFIDLLRISYLFILLQERV